MMNSLDFWKPHVTMELLPRERLTADNVAALSLA
jgi:hypothetical protein